MIPFLIFATAILGLCLLGMSAIHEACHDRYKHATALAGCAMFVLFVGLCAAVHQMIGAVPLVLR